MFGLFKRNIYLDHNATTPVSKSVRNTINKALKHSWGNPSSGYQLGKNAAQVIEHARRSVAESIHAHPHEIYFTGCATEANNAVLKTLSSHFYPKKKKIISTPIEHSSITNTLQYLSTQGIEVEYCKVDKNGFVSIEELEKMIDENTFLICCMYANNEIGTILNLKEIAAMAKSHGVLVLADCVQAFGKIPINVKELGVDYAIFAAHKLYGPKGVGALYSKITSPLEPFLHGGGQEEGMRAGTESIHNIAGFGRACEDVENLLANSRKIQSLKELFIQSIKQIKPDVIINSSAENCLPNTISITFPDINNRELMMMLDYHGIAVSAGSACSAHSAKPSRVLKAIGLSDKAASETIRVSLGKDTSVKDIKYTVKVIAKYLKENSNSK